MRHFYSRKEQRHQCCPEGVGVGGWGFPECPMFCTQHRGVSPGLLLLDQEGPREGGQRASVRLPCVIANS